MGFTPPSSLTIFGTVHKSDGTAAWGALVSVAITRGSQQSAVAATMLHLSAQQVGNWTLNLGSLRTADLSVWFQAQDSDTLTITVQGGSDGVGAAAVSVQQARTSGAGTITLGQGITLSLQAGWNLIALPVQPGTAYTAASLLAEINAQAGSTVAGEIDRWQNGGWEGHLRGLPVNNFSLAAGQGYFVKLTQGGVTWTPQ